MRCRRDLRPGYKYLWSSTNPRPDSITYGMVLLIDTLQMMLLIDTLRMMLLIDTLRMMLLIDSLTHP